MKSTPSIGRGSLPAGAAARLLLAAWLTLPAATSVLAGEQKGETADRTYQQAYEKGRERGLLEGRADRRANKPFNLEAKKTYREAKLGFEPARHDRDIYYSAFRNGYKAGYEEAYGVSTPSSDEAAPTPRPAPVVHSADRPVDPDGEWIINAGRDMAVLLRETLSTRRNVRGDTFLVETTRDILATNRAVAIPEGTPIQGTVAYVRRPGRIKGKAELKLRFDEIVFGEGRTVPVSATVVSVAGEKDRRADSEGTLSGEGSGKDDAKTVGASAGIGVLIGILTGGKKGGAIGAGAGAVIGLGGILTRRGRELTLDSKTILVIRLDRPVVIPPRVRRAD